MAFRDWFFSAGPRGTDIPRVSPGNVQLRGYFRLPEKLTCFEIPNQDETAARLQEEARQLLEDLAEYRQALAERYAALSVAPYKLCLNLIRRPSRYSGVTFDVTLFQIYEDGTTVKEIDEHYTGKQRREAIARYEDLKRSHPGIEAKKDIARRSWER